MILLNLPIRTVGLNQMRREHWRLRSDRSLKQRQAVRFGWLEAGRPTVELPCTVVLTRVAWAKLDSDNLVASMKAVRDEVAACLGVDDGGDEVEWVYRQEDRVVKRGEYFVKIAIESRQPRAA